MNYNSNGSWRGLCYGIKGKVQQNPKASAVTKKSVTGQSDAHTTCYGMSVSTFTEKRENSR
jgi:hypothetical protein